MNPLNEKLNKAIQDYRDQTAPAIDNTRRYVLARIRRERLQRRILGGGSIAMLLLVLYFVLGRTEPPAQPLTTVADAVRSGAVNPASRMKGNAPEAIQVAPTVILPTVVAESKRSLRAVALPTQAHKRGSSNSALTYAITHDAFVDESIALTSRATNAVIAENLPLAAESYRDLARLCEKRMKWKRAVAAYDSAVSYATRIGDTHLLQDLTREKALASKKVVSRK